MKWEVAICKKLLPSLCGPLAFMKLEVCRHLAIYREKSKRPKKKKGGVWRAIKLIKKFSKKSSSFWGLSWGPSGPSWAPSGLSSFPWRNYLNPFQPYWSLVQLYEKPAKWLTHLGFGRKNFSSKFGFFLGSTVPRKIRGTYVFSYPKGLLFFFGYPLALFGLSAYPFNDLGEVFPKPVWANGVVCTGCWRPAPAA